MQRWAMHIRIEGFVRTSSAHHGQHARLNKQEERQDRRPPVLTPALALSRIARLHPAPRQLAQPHRGPVHRAAPLLSRRHGPQESPAGQATNRGRTCPGRAIPTTTIEPGGSWSPAHAMEDGWMGSGICAACRGRRLWAVRPRGDGGADSRPRRETRHERSARSVGLLRHMVRHPSGIDHVDQSSV